MIEEVLAELSTDLARPESAAPERRLLLEGIAAGARLSRESRGRGCGRRDPPRKEVAAALVRAGKGLVRDDHGQAHHGGGRSVMIELEVLYEDNHCLAVNKPAGLLSQGDRSGEPSLVDVAAHYLKTRYAKPGNVFVGLLASSGPAGVGRDAAGEDRQGGRHGSPSSFAQGRSRSFTGRSSQAHRRTTRASGPTCSRRTAGRTVRRRSAREIAPARKPRSSFGCCRSMAVALEARARAAIGPKPSASRAACIPRLADPRGYQVWIEGAAEGSSTGGCASRLHARQITFTHPTRREAVTIVAPVPADWPESSPGWPERGCGSSTPGAGPGR